MLTAAIIKSLQIFGIAAAVSAVVALLIKTLVVATARLERKAPAEVPLGTVCPIGEGVPEEDVFSCAAGLAEEYEHEGRGIRFLNLDGTENLMCVDDDGIVRMDTHGQHPPAGDAAHGQHKAH